MKTTKTIICTCTALALAISASVHATRNDNCSGTPTNPQGGDSRDLESALQHATNTGRPLRLSGTYRLSRPVMVFIRNDLNIDASSATFIATRSLDGDMISIDANTRLGTTCGPRQVVDIEWDGGNFDMSDARVSTVVPIASLTPSANQGVSSTADALSVRGTPNSGSTLSSVSNVNISNATFNGTDSNTAPYFEAGGDSAIFVNGVLSADINNNTFAGIRDAAIYLSTDSDGVNGDNYRASGNTIRRAYDGITVKRGADNIVITGNTLNDVVVGISTKNVIDGVIHSNVRIRNNTITTTSRGMLIEHGNNVDIENNTINNLGAANGGSNSPSNASARGIYDGIALEGTSNVRITGNTIAGVTSTSRQNNTTTWGIVRGAFENRRETTEFSQRDNTFRRLDRNNTTR